MRTFLPLGTALLLTCSLKATDPSTITSDRVDFFRTPLVCGAAPDIGCGSRAKPLLLELERNAAVESAWLDRPGNTIAVVWKEAKLSRKQRIAVIKQPFAAQAIPIELVKEAGEHERLLAALNGGGGWYRGAAVDALSLEEAGVIADNIVGQLLDAKLVEPAPAEQLRNELRGYFEVELVQLRTRDELFGEALQARWRSDIAAIGEIYVGAGKMPQVQIRSSKSKGCETGGNKDCCKGKGKTASCEH